MIFANKVFLLYEFVGGSNTYAYIIGYQFIISA